ncbi:maleate cis-trans isomerase family protein [Streptomonospora litoralis]|uniref:Arylmalonate decarboxylase n=1 Tax=Streptomonospora litoralis TaxID=2498135 RepID=A0A4V0ZKD3_9ACTN|nr:maleate cis-trans isomerase [Streptomonospora litoralis]QBI56582.1 Arylmalonate decarboxylase [Streptomonospora litoralis]
MTSVGFLYPGYSAEDDYPVFERMLGGDVRLHLVHTLMREDAHRIDALLDVGGSDVLGEGARELRARGVDAAVWACTSGSFVFGWEGARTQADAVAEEVGAPASSTSFAFVNAVRALGIGRVAIAASYPDDVAERFVEFLGAAGTEVVAWAGRGIVTAAEVGTLQPADVLDWVAAGDDPGAEAVLVPDTALHSAAVLEDLEARLGKTVLTANQVSIWEGLRLAGVTAPREGLGSLFRAGAQAAAAAEA